MPQFENREINPDDLPAFEKVLFAPVQRKLLFKALCTWLIWGVILLSGAGALYFKTEGEDQMAVAVMGGILLLFFLVRLIDILLRQKYYGYAIREKDILFRKGYLFRRITTIPYNRIQHSALNQSFLERLFGLTTLRIYTAGGSGSDITIPGLDPERATQINEFLTQKIRVADEL